MSVPAMLPSIWYPAAMVLAPVVFGVLHAAGVHLVLSLYAPLIVVVLLVLTLERMDPARTEWRPVRADVEADLAFLAVVQFGVPRLLTALVVLTLAQAAHERMPSAWWPHAWPLPAQTLLMLLLVDFSRYWLHRAGHVFGPLWRLHAVHHSPRLLYVLNVGRFHPIEKGLQFCVDALPYLLLGVAPEVIGGYFLLYAVNGVFQHSNVRLHYGWLNYVVGSAPTHRWHHARDPREAMCNFGTTTILWDHVFGTFHLPSDREVGRVGIPDDAYPQGFLAQMAIPFRRTRAAPLGFKRRLADVLLAPMLDTLLWWHGRRLVREARDPMRVQRALLARIVHRNRATTFGRRHGFALIDGYAAYAARVPVTDYEALRPLIEAELASGERTLTSSSPDVFARTSGSTGKPKDVPLTGEHLAALRRVQQLAVALQHRACPQAFRGSLLVITSAAEEGRMPDGRPYGSASGIVAGGSSSLVRAKFIVPREVMSIADARLKYLLILRLALARTDVTLVATANPTTLLALGRLAREHAAALLQDLRGGGFFLADRLEPDVRATVAALLVAAPQRARTLASVLAPDRDLRLADLWPDVRMAITWTGGSAGVAAGALRRELPEGAVLFELGYAASEFRGTFTLGRRAAAGMPTLATHFFEFVERSRWDRGEPEFLTLDRIRKGPEYYVFVTTPSGLYRYFINDLVKVTGRFHATPLLRFVQKGRGVTSITGEKLYESQVLDATCGALAALGLAPRYLVMLADEARQSYRLYVEPDRQPEAQAAELAAAVDRRLAALNIEYAAKRDSGRLGLPQAVWLRPGAGEACKQVCVAQGQREGQFKASALAYRHAFGFDVDAWSVRDE